MVSQKREIVIIGGGIIGCCSAYYLTRHKSYDPTCHKVTLLEASEIAGGASGKAGGLLALWAYPSSIVPLSFKLHAELAKEHGGAERWGYRHVKCGQVVAAGQLLQVENEADGIKTSTSSSVSLGKRDTAAIGKLIAAGVPTDLDWLVPQGLIQYESMAQSGETAQVHPYLFTAAMARLAEEGGAKIILGTATEIVKEDGGQGITSVVYRDKQTGETQTLPATDVIVSAGPWTRSVLPEAPVTSTRAHSVVIRPTRPVSAYTLFTNISLPPGFGSSKKSKSAVVNPEIYARSDNTVYACGEGDHITPLPETTAEVQVDQSRCQDIIDSVGSISDELRNGEVTVRQACYLPVVDTTRGGGPLIGHTGIEGLYLATGHTCWGIQNAPGTGKLMSEFVFEGTAQSAKVGSLDPRNYM